MSHKFFAGSLRCALLLLLITSLSSCLGSLWTGADLVYDRHNVYKKLQDYRLLVQTSNVLYRDNQFKIQGCAIDITVFNGDILVAGHVASANLLEEASVRLQGVHGYKRLFNRLQLRTVAENPLQDAWITSKIRTRMFADRSIDLKTFKIITMDGIVYLMGDVHMEEAQKVIYLARHTDGVLRVVKMLRYFKYT